MTTPELAAKWGVEPSELALAFDFLNAHHLRFVTVIEHAALTIADPAATKIAPGALEMTAAPAVGVSPQILALLLQITQTVFPLIAQILTIFLSSLIPLPLAKAPVPAPTKPAASD